MTGRCADDNITKRTEQALDAPSFFEMDAFAGRLFPSIHSTDLAAPPDPNT